MQAKVKNIVFVNLDSTYVDYFPEYSNYFGIFLRLLKSTYGITNSGKLFTDESTEWLIEAGFIQSQCNMSIYYNYALDGSIIVVLSYVDECVYWYMLLLLLLFRSPGRMPCPNYEAVEFQPRVDNSALDAGCPAHIL